MSLCAFASPQQLPKPTEGDFVAHEFHFRSGEVVPELRLHYRTIEQPTRDANGHVTNAVIIIVHGTGGNGGWLVRNEAFAAELFRPGQLLDATRYYVIFPDALGHGQSSKPSDGLHARFPHYDYDDMVEAEHLLLTEGLKIDLLRLFMGMSMGCMHAFLFADERCSGRTLIADRAFQPRVLRAVHLTHPACAQGIGYFVRAKTCPRRQSHPSPLFDVRGFYR